MRFRFVPWVLTVRGALAAALAVATGVSPAQAGPTVHYHMSNGYSDAPHPIGKLAVGPGGLYGFTQSGGEANGGTLYKMTTSGLTTKVADIDPALGPNQPAAGPLYISTPSAVAGFYGVSTHGGNSGQGTVFRVTTGGTVTAIYSFFGGADGAVPSGTLLQGLDGYLYGVTVAGGHEPDYSSNDGTIYRVKPDGNGYEIMHNFDVETEGVGSPTMGLVEANGYLYGLTNNATGHGGALYRLKISDKSFQVLKYFDDTQLEGTTPNSELIRATDGHLYGTCQNGGVYGAGTIFRYNIATNQLVMLWSFDGYTGAHPGEGQQGPVRLLEGADKKIYGVTPKGGMIGYGTVFKYDPVSAYCTLIASFNYLDANQQPNPLVQSGSTFFTTSYHGGATAFLGGPFGVPAGYGCAMSIALSGVVKNIHSFHIQDILHAYGGLTLFNSAAPYVFYGVAPEGGVFEQGAIFKIDSTGKFSIIHSMNNALGEGIGPWAALVKAADGNMYGSTTGGGAYGSGTLFKVTSSGAVTVIHHFRGNLNGYHPHRQLVQGLGTDKMLYGTARHGGPLGKGTAFSIDTAGKSFRVIHHFGGPDGAGPACALTPDLGGSSSTQMLYGTTAGGGANGAGVIFKMNPTGSTYVRLHSFDGTSSGSPEWAGALLLRNGKLIGTTHGGGVSGQGTLFFADLASGSVSVLHDFGANAAQGAHPVGTLAADGAGNVYGVTYSGGSSGYGTVYRFHLDTAQYTVLADFLGQPGNEPGYAHDGVVLAGGNMLFGTSYAGGSNDHGTIYSLSTTP